MRHRIPARWVALLFIGLGVCILLSPGLIEAQPRTGARRGLLASPQHGAVGLFGLALVFSLADAGERADVIAFLRTLAKEKE